MGEDSDPSVFFLHLYHSLRKTMPFLSENPLLILEEKQEPGRWFTAVDLLCNEMADRPTEPALLILDDFHLLNEASDTIRLVDRFIGRMPPHLYVIISTRYSPSLPSLLTWRARGEVLEIRERELTFTSEEIAALFRNWLGIPQA